MKVLDLFSGIGGFSLGLERAGMETVAFCEIEPFPQKVLKKHWPNVPIYNDVMELTNDRLKADGIDTIDIITGGFPCQDLSGAGHQRGIEAERSGLWAECARLISEIQPKYAIFENVSALLTGESGGWFSRLLCDLASLGYDAEWHCIPASAVGASHHRDRVWVVAHPTKVRRANDRALFNRAAIKITHKPPKEIMGIPHHNELLSKGNLPDLRKDNGVQEAVDRLGAIGNAVFPDIPEIIGRAIMEIEGLTN